MDIRLGLVSLARPTFDTTLATQVSEQVHTQLEQAGFSLVGPQTLVSSLDEARELAQELAEAPLDLLLILQATFADSTMAMSLAQAVDTPLLLWAVPEAHTGGRLRLNSFCGINLAGHALRRAGHRYDYVYAAPDDPAALEQVRTLALAGRARRLLRHARIGRVGEHPGGFDSCKIDRDALKRCFGLEVVQIDLENIFQSVRTIDSQEIKSILQELNAKLDNLDQLDQSSLQRTLGTFLTLRRFAEQEQFDGLAVRCWPEFFTELGCAACGAMSMLSDELIPCSCEADINGTITQLVLQSLSGQPAFGTDVVSMDVEKDAVVVWHCGLAPLSMADPLARPKGTVHSNRQLPLLMEFPLKPGRVTIARLSEATGGYRLVVGRGEMLRAPLSFSGTSGVLRFDQPAAQVFDVILKEGLEHHISLTFGDHVPALLALSSMLNIPVLHL